MSDSSLWQMYGEAAKTSVGFFWKAGWAFVLGYAVSAMIQAFVPKKRLTEHMGAADLQSLSLVTLFGAASSSCSFAALAAARSLIMKGANFIAAVAFMFASIVLTALIMHFGFAALDLTPESSRRINHAARFAVDYTFFMNLAFALAAVLLVGLNRGWQRHEAEAEGHDHDHGGGLSVKRLVAFSCAAVVAVGVIAHLIAGGTG